MDSWLTLTTCWPKYGSSKRLIAVAELDDVLVDGRSTLAVRRADAGGAGISAAPVASP